jgi:hypothetical protein
MSHIVLSTMSYLGFVQFDINSENVPTTETEYNAIVLTDPKPSWSDFQVQLEIQKKRIGGIMLRNMRNKMIAGCDWLMTVDNVATLANKDEWIAYRQLLRDLPDSGVEIVFTSDYSALDPFAMSLPVRPKIVRTTP